MLLTGCGTDTTAPPEVTGIVTEHEYHPFVVAVPAVAPKAASGCGWKGSGKSRVWTCRVPAQPGRAAIPAQPEWWELEITTANGTEIDMAVSRDVYESYADGDVYPHPSNPQESSSS